MNLEGTMLSEISRHRKTNSAGSHLHVECTIEAAGDIANLFRTNMTWRWLLWVGVFWRKHKITLWSER